MIVNARPSVSRITGPSASWVRRQPTPARTANNGRRRGALLAQRSEASRLVAGGSSIVRSLHLEDRSKLIGRRVEHHEVRGGSHSEPEPLLDLTLIVRARADVRDACLDEQIVHRVLQQVPAHRACRVEELTERAPIGALMEQNRQRHALFCVVPD